MRRERVDFCLTNERRRVWRRALCLLRGEPT